MYGQSVVYWPAWEMHCNILGLVLGLGLVRVSSIGLGLGLALEQAGWQTSPYFAVTGQ